MYTHSIMKKINIWKILGLSIITLGIYTLFWIIRRRQEMVTIYKQAIPHAGWIVAVVVLSYIGSGLSWGAEYLPDAPLQAIAVVIALILLTVGFVISVWWIWRFSKAAAYVTAGRVPAGWSFVLYLLASPVIMAMILQHYFNQAAQPSKLQDNPPAKASPKLKLLALALIIIPMIGYIWYGISSSQTTFKQVIEQQNQINEYSEKAGRLAKDHQACVDKLNQDYKEVTSENQVAYQKAYDACEEIRKEQNKAVDDYNRLLSE
jgi:hypothetical protein